MLLGENQLFLDYLSSILYYSTCDFEEGFALDIVAVKNLVSGSKTMNLKKLTFKNNIIKENERRKNIIYNKIFRS